MADSSEPNSRDQRGANPRATKQGSAAGGRRPAKQAQSSRADAASKAADRRADDAGSQRPSKTARTDSRSGRPSRSGGPESAAKRVGPSGDRVRPASSNRAKSARAAQHGPDDQVRKEGVRPGKQREFDEPDAPEYDESLLPFAVKAELRGLSPETARRVGGHLLAAGELLDVDPQLAFKHAKAARRLAGRLPVVREVAAEVAYEAGEYESALTDFRALHRMTGDPNFLPIIADCERALGRHQAALRTLRQADGSALNAAQRAEAVLVAAGVRDDLDQGAEAARLLKKAIESGVGGKPEQARLRFGYAQQLLKSGQREQAMKWFDSAHKHDADGSLNVPALLAELEGEPAETEFEDFEIIAVEEEPEQSDALTSQLAEDPTANSKPKPGRQSR